MLPNLLAELAGVSLEIGIAILVIERVASAHRRRQWSSAYGALSDRAAMTFVDVMRLLWVRSSKSGLEVNGDRYDEFYDLLKLHLAEFRSNIEGFATLLEPPSHEALRRVDAYLSWATSKRASKPIRATGTLEFAETMREAAVTLDAFLRGYGGASYRAEVTAVDVALQAVDERLRLESTEDLDGTLALRLAAQTELLRDRGGPRPRPRGIWYDANKDLAVGYFLIDHHILTHYQSYQ